MDVLINPISIQRLLSKQTQSRDTTNDEMHHFSSSSVGDPYNIYIDTDTDPYVSFFTVFRIRISLNADPDPGF